MTDPRALLHRSARGSWHALARQLDAEGLTNGQIAARCGVTASAVSKALNPERAREYNRRENAHRREIKTLWDRENYQRIRKDRCECGTTKIKGSERCQECYDATAAVRRTLAEGMWAAGWTLGEMGDAFGVKGCKYFPAQRVRGWDLPHRRTAEQVARIRAGSLRGRGLADAA